MLMIRTTPLDDATVVDRRGRRRPETLEAIEVRNRLLIDAASTHMPGRSSRAAAHKLHAVLSRYREGAWRRERTSESVPLRHQGRIEEVCWSILKLRDVVPAERTIRAAIDKKSGDPLFVANDARHTRI
jgi:hypothetical protein